MTSPLSSFEPPITSNIPNWTPARRTRHKAFRSSLQRSSLLLTSLLSALVLVPACSDEPDSPRPDAVEIQDGAGVPAELRAELRSRLDSANAAFRAGDLEVALDHFTTIAQDEPGFTPGWYGMGMTLRAMGDTAAADSAMLRMHELAPDLPLEHPQPGAPANPHPRAHPNPPSPDRDSTGGAPSG